MKKILLFVAFAMLALIFQGCPGTFGPALENDIYAYLYTPADSVYVRYYYIQGDREHQKHEDICAPSKGVTVIKWYSDIQGDSALHDDEYHNLHVRKLSNQTPAYVLLCQYVTINGMKISWTYLPSRYYDPDNSTEFPFIEQVIDSLLIHYPETVVSIDDMQEQSIHSNKSLAKPVSIQI